MNPVAKLGIVHTTASVDQLTVTEFPTGPNALRLFIPNIDICSGGESAAAKRTRAVGCGGGGGVGGVDARNESARSPNSDNHRKRSNVNECAEN